MQPAALGLTCKDAFTVFSQNETLALQKRVSALEEEIKHWKKLYFRQLQRIEWAGDLLQDLKIRCGCNYGDCDECGHPADSCTCMIKMCGCKDCAEDRELWGKAHNCPSPVYPDSHELVVGPETYDESWIPGPCECYLTDINADGMIVSRSDFPRDDVDLMKKPTTPKHDESHQYTCKQVDYLSH